MSNPADAVAPGAGCIASAAVGERLALPAINPLIAALILALFVLSCLVSATRPDVTTGFDEPAHASFVAHIQHSGDAWPALDKMCLLDPRTFQFTQDANYLNHPPLYYALLAAIGPALEARPQALLAHRLINIGLVAAGLAVLFALGLSAQFSRPEFYAYAMPLAWIPILVQLAASISNDNLAFLGGAMAVLGVGRSVAANRSTWLAVALAGVLAAGWAKLTGLLLTGTMLSAALFYLLCRSRLRLAWAIAAGFAFLLAAAPYAIYFAEYGSPTPETPAQIALLHDGALAAGWADLPRKSFPEYLVTFGLAFVAHWMPVVGARSAFNYAMLIIPLTALACALAGLGLSLRRVLLARETPLDVIVIAGAAALAATCAVHVGYSYSRHLATGWLLDAYPRYYLPLAPIVPLAGLSLARAVQAAAWRARLLGFLTVGPILFRVFGAPLG